MKHRICIGWIAVALCVGAASSAVAQGYAGYPNSIMTPEPGSRAHHSASERAPLPSRHASLLGREKFVGKLHRPHGVFVVRGSSGSVLPTPLPRTGLIAPEGPTAPQFHTPAMEQNPTMVPGVGTVPNLPHGAETFQDRASRCSFQAGLYGVPNGAQNQYMGACVQ